MRAFQYSSLFSPSVPLVLVTLPIDPVPMPILIPSIPEPMLFKPCIVLKSVLTLVGPPLGTEVISSFHEFGFMAIPAGVAGKPPVKGTGLSEGPGLGMLGPGVKPKFIDSSGGAKPFMDPIDNEVLLLSQWSSLLISIKLGG